ncbi:MAG: hypothetical protein K1W22_01775 [Lachnospiraceae bacterium]
MEEISRDIPQWNMIADSIQYKVLSDENSAEDYCNKIPYINIQLFLRICKLYEYPITVICQLRYTDKMYRDAYYIYLSHLHFDVGRHCQRLALFKGQIALEKFFDSDCHDELQASFLGTIVIRPSYNHSAEYTLGRTLLNPYKLKRPFRYIRTAKYKASICGQTYTVDAFPFSNQHGDVMRCAETSVWALMEYYGTRYENYRVVLPSTISNWASKELSVRSLPSEGLTYSQISSLLKTFNFEPRIYERNAYKHIVKISEKELIMGSGESDITRDEADCLPRTEFMMQCEIEAEAFARKIDREIKDILRREHEENEKKIKENGELRQLSLHNLFHYYVESGIPLITAVCNNRENIHHSIVVIGHDERSPYKQTRENIKSQKFTYGTLEMIDSSSLYNRYITIDDNQYPYRSEVYDHFSMKQNCKVEAFIVPLYRHILLDAEPAVSIIETVYKDSVGLLESTLEQLKEEESIKYQENSIDNPIVLRYYLTTSRGFVDFRNRDTEYLEEKLFYSTTAFPKFIWVGEYSTLELYCQGKILGEIIIDATAPKYSGMGAVIAMRFGGRCAARQTDESPEVLRKRLQDIEEQQAQLLYSLYTKNLQKGE